MTILEDAVQPVLVAGDWRESGQHESGQRETFTAFNPSTGVALPERFPVSSLEEVQAAIEAGWKAAQILRTTAPERIADFLEAYAKRIEADRSELMRIAALETGYAAEPRLNSIELPRTSNQLRLAAKAARERSWTRPTIDTALNIRSMLAALGAPVVIFGPNNFPFAFNAISGGDFAAAIAAGNPVIAKAHTAHPGTTQRLAQHALEALLEAGLPAASVQLLYHMAPEVGLRLVSHEKIGAVAFTGSKLAGLGLKAAADRAGKPFYAELSSVNPVFVLPGALEERCEAIVDEFYVSCTSGAGQFCTNPGLVVLPSGEAGERFAQLAAARFSGQAAGVLLSTRGAEGFGQALHHLLEHGASLIAGGQASGPGSRFESTLLRVQGEHFLAHADELQREAFGPSSLLVFANPDQMLEVTTRLEGSLTSTIYSHSDGRDDTLYNQLEPSLRQRTGRLLNDKMPTGVAVSAAMNHGGPYPASSHPGFTSVGIPASLTRFAALHCYDNVRASRLPPELRDENPLQVWQCKDGQWDRSTSSRPAHA
jgi:2,5-dioxopentanoate dehydrogenase